MLHFVYVEKQSPMTRGDVILENRMVRAARAALEDLRDSVPLDKLEGMIRTMGPRDVANALSAAKVSSVAEAIISAAGLDDAETANEAKRLANQLLTQAREAVMTTVERGKIAGRTDGQIAADVQATVSLTGQQAKLVADRRDKLLEDGVPARKADKLASAYADQLVSDRSMLIGTTEATGASGSKSLDAMAAQGYNAKEWVSRKDAKVCDTCRALDGQVVALDENFNADGEEFFSPGAHPRCRCRARGANIKE